MRLLSAEDQTFQEFADDKAPPYAVLSHTWGAEEVTFEEIRCGLTRRESKAGWKKIQNCCRQAIKDGLEFVWIDTCCIDKSSSAELQEAINSMFRWYEMSLECYAHISDFNYPSLDDEPLTVERALLKLPLARWFTRGWTLQELLAPCSVRFFDSTWSEFGDKISMRKCIASATGIHEEILLGSVVSARQAMESASIAQRMSWAACRTTTREEDVAYCMLGIFDVNMPLLYGEGPKAFQRLQEEILKMSDDQSILAWGFNCETPSLWGVSAALAQSPSDFAACAEMVSWGAAKSGDSFSMTQRGLQLNLPVSRSLSNGDLLYCMLNCTTKTRASAAGTRVLVVPLLHPLTRTDDIRSKPDEYYRLSSRIPVWADKKELITAHRMTVYLPRFYKHGDLTRPRLHLSLDFGSLPPDYYISGIFPPERSKNTLFDIRLDSRTSTSVVMIHFARYQLPGFVLFMKSKREPHDGESPKALLSDQAAYNRDITNLINSPPNVLTNNNLRKLVLEIFASELGLELNDISETRSLEDMGIDSLMSLSIAGRLREEIGVHFGSDLLFRSKTIRDVQDKLRLTTRPYFRLCAKSGGEIQSTQSSLPRITLSEPLFTVMEVASSASLVEHNTIRRCLDTARNMHEDSQTIFAVAKEMTLSVSLDTHGARHSLRLRLSSTK